MVPRFAAHQHIDEGVVTLPAIDQVGLTEPIRQFLDANADLPTPYLVIDLDVVDELFGGLTAALPGMRILYAVKANPAVELLERLAGLGCGFDVASPGEIERCLKLGIEPEQLSYGNTIKKEQDIAFAWSSGIRTFAVDSHVELSKLLRQARGSTVYIRLATDGSGADWPLSRKFGCDVEIGFSLARRAAAGGMSVGLSFHVGSQQRCVTAWHDPLASVGHIVSRLQDDGIDIAGVNIGGGFPSTYEGGVPHISAYGESIRDALATHLGPNFTGEIVAEPGRYLVGDAGVIETEVVLVAPRPGPNGSRWVYVDVGVFNGLSETLGEAIRYRIDSSRECGSLAPAVLAGPSCDSVDVLYQREGFELPADLQPGDRLRLLATGAYTSAYSSEWFNGFESLQTYFVTSRDQVIQSEIEPLVDLSIGANRD